MIDFGQRLQAARKLKGLSMDQLSKDIGNLVSKAAIGKYEKNRMFPRSEVLIAIARALDVKPAFFFKKPSLSFSGIKFKSKKKLSKKKEEEVSRKALYALEPYIEIESILNDQLECKDIDQFGSIKDEEDIEKVAELLRQKWNLGDGPISHLTEILEDRGFRILNVKLPNKLEGLSGFTSEADLPVIILSLKGVEPQYGEELVRRRFTIAHELGHLILKFDSNTSDNEIEKACNHFAGALLLPRNALYRELNSTGKLAQEVDGSKTYRKKISGWELKKIKGIYGVSILTIMNRAVELRMISKANYSEFKSLLKKHKLTKENEPGQYYGKEVANRFEQLVYSAAAENIITISKGAELLNKSVSSFRDKVRGL